MLTTSSSIMLAFAIATPEAAFPPSIAPETRAMMEQPLAPFEDQCRENDGVQVRRVRFATLDAAGRNHEDRIELRTTTTGAIRVLEYVVNGAVIFIQSTGETLQPTPTGVTWLRATDGGRVTKILAAFAAAHPRILAADYRDPAPQLRRHGGRGRGAGQVRGDRARRLPQWNPSGVRCVQRPRPAVQLRHREGLRGEPRLLPARLD